MLVNTLLTIVFFAIILSGIAISTYLVGSDSTKRWLVYPIFSAICIVVFLIFKYSTNTTLLFWRQAFLMVSFYVPAVCSLMAFVAMPKTSIKALKESVFPATSIFAICAVLLIIF